MASTTVPLAYSYTRFSSAEQAHGDSFRRQTEAAAKWCETEGGGLALDTSLRDLGVSGFKGRNAKVGALQTFLKAIRDGLVAPGSVLVLEDLDRLSRDEALEALDTLRLITGAGVDVVTLMDRKRYTKTSIRELAETISIVLLFSRGHEESKKKSQRLTAAWAQKRKAATLGVPMVSHCPPWLKVSNAKNGNERHDWKTTTFAPIPERVKWLQQMFAWSIGGWGYRRITKELIRLNVAPWGVAAWSVNRVSKFIVARTALGEFQPCKRTGGQHGNRVPYGDPVKGYFPQIISEETWQAAQSNVTGRKGGRPGTAILSGLVLDPEGQKMTYASAPKCRYLVSNTLGKIYRWQAEHLETAVLAITDGLDWERIFTDRAQEPERARLEKEIATLDGEEIKLKQQADRLVEIMLESGKSVGDAFRKKSVQLDEAADDIQSRRAIARARIEALRRTVVSVGGTPLPKTIPATKDGLQRLREELRSRLEKIQVWPDGRPPGKSWKTFIANATEQAPPSAVWARANGRVMGAIRLYFQNGKAITAFVTFVIGARARTPAVLGFADPVGMSLEDWNDYIKDTIGPVPADAGVVSTGGGSV